MESFDVVTVGNATLDNFLWIHDSNEHFRLNEETRELCIKMGDKSLIDKAYFLVGGNAANVAVGLSRMGLKTGIFAELGSDEFAQKIINTLAIEGVSEIFLRKTKEHSTSFSIILNFKGDRTIFEEKVKKTYDYSFDTLKTKWIYLTSMGEDWEEPYARVAEFVSANRENIGLAFNPGSSQLDGGAYDIENILKITNILFVNKEEAEKILKTFNSSNLPQEEYIKKLLEGLKEKGAGIVAMTDGPNGAFLINENKQIYFQKAIDAESYEKTGAGDAFASGFLSAVLLGYDYQTAMNWGSLNSASVIGKVGAQEGLLRRDEIDKNNGKAGLGYANDLFILPFDHRSTFAEKMFGVSDVRNLTDEQNKAIKEEKQIIYDAFKKAISEGVPKESAGILVDEEYGGEILKDAGEKGFITLLTTEKSGQREFILEYGEDFAQHIKKFNPIFAKALVRYNPEDEEDQKNRQLAELKKLSDFCHSNNFKFMIEILIGPTEKQLQEAGGDRIRYDKEIRPRLEVDVIKEFQEKKIEPDVWKLEGLQNSEDYQKLIEQAQKNGRSKVGIVVLGRGARQEEVEQWIIEGAKTKGVIGFAVGRTIFWDALALFQERKITRDEAVERIARNYKHFYNLFMQGRSNI